ncbi:hypothetical protein V6Z11_D01G120200 [Gossypium hirsutum]
MQSCGPVQNGQISIEHIGTNSMIADPLTKGLPPKVFHEHTGHMGVTLFEDIMIRGRMDLVTIYVTQVALVLC